MTGVEPRPPWSAAPASTPPGPDASAPAVGDGDVEASGEGRATLDLDAVTADLAAVEAALERLDQGGYGRCGACASEIDDDVLAADPTATTCAAHLPV